MTNSGELDQNATIVKPITNEEIPNFFAIELAQSTSKSDHLINKRKPMINRI
jgi:hypothetical protein